VLTLLEKDAGSSSDENTLLHGESLSVVSSSDSEDVAFIVVTHVLSVDLGAHAPVKEWATVQKQIKWSAYCLFMRVFICANALGDLHVFFFIDFNFLVSACGRVRNVKL
jgi:hypothetical protein